VEHGGNRALGSERLRRWLDGAARIQKPEAPAFRGAVTVAEAREAADPLAYREAVERWGRATWDAYAPLHG
jgi:hypothetical protein